MSLSTDGHIVVSTQADLRLQTRPIIQSVSDDPLMTISFFSREIPLVVRFISSFILLQKSVETSSKVHTLLLTRLVSRLTQCLIRILPILVHSFLHLRMSPTRNPSSSTSSKLGRILWVFLSLIAIHYSEDSTPTSQSLVRSCLLISTGE